MGKKRDSVREDGMLGAAVQEREKKKVKDDAPNMRNPKKEIPQTPRS
jgi:hypothetical protein